jgi:hypothetical protein
MSPICARLLELPVLFQPLIQHQRIYHRRSIVGEPRGVSARISPGEWLLASRSSAADLFFHLVPELCSGTRLRETLFRVRTAAPGAK